MVRIHREADRAPVAAVAKKHGVSEPTIYAWRQQFGAPEAMDVRQLKTVERESAEPEKRLAERDLEIEVTKGITCGKHEACPSVVGPRRVRIPPRREGNEMPPDRCRWRWQQAALRVPCQRPRRRVSALADRPLPQG